MASPAIITEARDFWPAITCAKCSTAVRLSPGTFVTHYDAGDITCGECGQVADLWSSLLSDLTSDLHGGFVLGTVGCTTTQFRVTPVANQENQISFASIGLPPGSTVLRLSLGALRLDDDAIVRPLVISPRDLHPTFAVSDPICFYPAPTPECPRGNNRVALGEATVTWVAETLPTAAWLGLVRGFDAFERGDLAGAVIPAQSAVELGLDRLLSPATLTRLRPDWVDPDGIVPYGVKSQELLPEFATEQGFPALDERIYRLLDNLAGRRNAVAHTGRLGSIGRDTIAEYLCAALFAFEYIRIFDSRANP